MPGNQLKFSRKGEQYEKAFDAVASTILSVLRVPRPEDYGCDAYCHVLRETFDNGTNAEGAFAVQIRGPGSKTIEFGGMRKKRTWRSYELEWLRTLAVPIYLVRVNRFCNRFDFYSLSPMWYVLGASASPYKIVCKLMNISNELFSLKGAETVGGGTHGDGITSTTEIGPPFLSFSPDDLENAEFRINAAKLLKKWVRYDRTMMMRLQLKIPILQSIGQWHTNSFQDTGQMVLKTWIATNSRPGENIAELTEMVEATVTALGWHLYQQNNNDALRLLPVIDWLRETQSLSRFGEQLREKLSPRPL